MSDVTAARVLTLPGRMDPDERVEILEATWWQLFPGQVGYNQPLWAYCGFASQELWNEWKRRTQR